MRTSTEHVVIGSGYHDKIEITCERCEASRKLDPPVPARALWGYALVFAREHATCAPRVVAPVAAVEVTP